MYKFLQAIFGNSTMNCIDEIKALVACNNLSDETLEIIRKKYPDELESWIHGKIFKIRMFEL